MTGKRGSVESRLLAHRKIVPCLDPKLIGDCWESTYVPTKRGYCRININGHHEYVHRIAYKLWVDDIPPGHTIDHKCRNILCFQPKHLECVTLAVNIQRMHKAYVTIDSIASPPQRICNELDQLELGPRVTRSLHRQNFKVSDDYDFGPHVEPIIRRILSWTPMIYAWPWWPLKGKRIPFTVKTYQHHWSNCYDDDVVKIELGSRVYQVLKRETRLPKTNWVKLIIERMTGERDYYAVPRSKAALAVRKNNYLKALAEIKDNRQNMEHEPKSLHRSHRATLSGYIIPEESSELEVHLVS
jgi:hypothetical protein